MAAVKRKTQAAKAAVKPKSAARKTAAAKQPEQAGKGPTFRVPQQKAARSFDAAQFTRLTEDWYAPLTTGDSELRTRIRTIRNRMRELRRNNPYARRFLQSLENNVFSADGVTLQMKAGDWATIKDPVTKKSKAEFKLDDYANRVIETAWYDWARDPLISGGMSLGAAMRVALTNTACDGDTLTKFLRGTQFNKYGFALQLFEGDIIDDLRNDSVRGQGAQPTPGNQVRMGVEVNPYMRPVAYWLLQNYPGDWQYWGTNGIWSDRFEAVTNDQPNFVHLFVKERITLVRGISWMVTAGAPMQMLDGFDEAAVVAARTGASKMGFFQRPVPDGAHYAGDDDGVGNLQMDAEPGAFEELPYGMEFKEWNPAYPSEAYAHFVKACLRRIASGLGMSYNTLASDLEGVNYSSLRAGVLDEREQYKAIQTWFIDRWLRPVFEAWLEAALLSGQINLPFTKLAKFNAPTFRPRRWDWVDPMRDVQADILAINNRLKTRNQVIAENGQGDFEDTIDEIAREEKYAADKGVNFPAIEQTPQQIKTGASVQASQQTEEPAAAQ